MRGWLKSKMIQMTTSIYLYRIIGVSFVKTGEMLIKRELVYDYKIEKLDIYIGGKKVFEKLKWEQILLSSFPEEEQYYILEEVKKRKKEKNIA